MGTRRMIRAPRAVITAGQVFIRGGIGGVGVGMIRVQLISLPAITAAMARDHMAAGRGIESSEEVRIGVGSHMVAPIRRVE